MKNWGRLKQTKALKQGEHHLRTYDEHRWPRKDEWWSGECRLQSRPRARFCRRRIPRISPSLKKPYLNPRLPEKNGTCPGILHILFLVLEMSRYISSSKKHGASRLVDYWLVVLTILKNISQWEGLSHIFWKIKAMFETFETTSQI